jgi:hypothetical protein
MSTNNQRSPEAFVAELETAREVIKGDGQAFTESFLGLQGLGSAITDEQLAALQALAEPVIGQPIIGNRNPLRCFLGDEEPHRVRSDSRPAFMFQGVLHGVELVQSPDEQEAAEELCLVIDPLSTSPSRAMRESAYHRDRGWRTYLYTMQDPYVTTDRLWVPGGPVESRVTHVTIDTGYIREAILTATFAQSPDQLAEVQALFPAQAELA